MPYDRKYRTTARGRASRKPPSARYKKPTYKKKVRYASRYSGVRAPRSQGIKRAVVRSLNDIAENRFIATKVTHITPNQLAYNPTNSVVHWNLGSTALSNVNTGLPTGGKLQQFSMGSTTHIQGKYAYIKRNTHMFQIRMKPIDNATFDSDSLAPVNFRVLMLANRARLNTLNVTPETNCFLSHANNVFGYDSNGVVDNMSIKTALVNKRDFVVLKDQQFVLSAPSWGITQMLPATAPDDITYSAAGGNQKLAVKMFKHVTQVNKKLEYNPSLTLGPPMGLANDVYCVILATSQSGRIATNWEVDLQSTTVYTDM